MDNFSTDFGKNMFGTKSLNFIGRIKKKSKENETNKNENNFNKTYDAAPIPIFVGKENNEKKPDNKLDKKENNKENKEKKEIKLNLICK